jgi:hypothetical protein
MSICDGADITGKNNYGYDPWGELNRWPGGSTKTGRILDSAGKSHPVG